MTRTTLTIAAAAALAALVTTAPAAADSHHHDRRGKYSHVQKNARANTARAYQQGYAAGARAPKRVYVVDGSRNRNYRNYNNSRYNNVRYQAQSPYWWGPGGQVYCRRSDGTTGLLIGAVAGGTLGNMVANYGDKTLGTVIGGALGGLIGREVDRGNARCR